MEACELETRMLLLGRLHLRAAREEDWDRWEVIAAERDRLRALNLMRQENVKEEHTMMRCVFALNTGRCGSMTLAKVLAQHPQITALHEPIPRLIEFSPMAYVHPNSDQTRLVIYVARNDLIGTVNGQGKLYVETANKLTFFAYALARLYPQSKFIHLMRHPVDVIKSGIRRKWYDGHSWDVGRITPQSGRVNGAGWQELPVSHKVAWNWVETNRFIFEFMDTLPPHRKMTLRLEEMEKTLPELWRFLEVPPLANPRIEPWNAGPRYGIKAEFEPFLTKIGGDVLRRSGYEIDRGAETHGPAQTHKEMAA